MKDEIFCLFEGALDNLGRLRQQYGLSKSVNEVVLVIEAYKALRDRAPYPPNHVVGHLSGNFAFVVFDKTTSTLFVASVSPLNTVPALPRIALGLTNFFQQIGPIGLICVYWCVTGSTREGPILLGYHCRWIRGVRR